MSWAGLGGWAGSWVREFGRPVGWAGRLGWVGGSWVRGFEGRSRVRVGELPESDSGRVLVVFVNGRGRDVGRAGRSPTAVAYGFSFGAASDFVPRYGFSRRKGCGRAAVRPLGLPDAQAPVRERAPLKVPNREEAKGESERKGKSIWIPQRIPRCRQEPSLEMDS